MLGVKLEYLHTVDGATEPPPSRDSASLKSMACSPLASGNDTPERPELEPRTAMNRSPPKGLDLELTLSYSRRPNRIHKMASCDGHSSSRPPLNDREAPLADV